jgi:catechol 2,3-dioxygenase-like lactoylglutathione lyase family enzyme
MPTIPVVHCRNVQESLAFYTRILDFEKKYPEARDTDWVIDLIRHDVGHDIGDGAEIHNHGQNRL